MLEQVDPIAYFETQRFAESTILRLSCNFRQRWIEAVLDVATQRIDSWYEAQLAGKTWAEFRRVNPPLRDLRQLVFCGVRQARCGTLDIRRSVDWPEAVEPLKIPGEMIAGVKIEREGNSYCVDFTLYHVASFRFRFLKLLADIRLARDVAPGSSVSLWDQECCDVRSGEPFVYEAPFPFPKVR